MLLSITSLIINSKQSLNIFQHNARFDLEVFLFSGN
nr:MAG TPA: hypothetical protein [Bacteriophage sp.]